MIADIDKDGRSVSGSQALQQAADCGEGYTGQRAVLTDTGSCHSDAACCKPNTQTHKGSQTQQQWW